MRKTVLLKSIAAIILGFGLLLIFRSHFLHMFSFSFVDEYNYPVSAFFMLQEKRLHQDIFFNHQILAVYMSYILQYIVRPQTMFALIGLHRLYVFAFSIFIGIILSIRFRWKGFLVFCLFEGIKYYYFGTHFLAESFIVYPLAYIYGVLLEKLMGIEMRKFDFWIVMFFSWFVVFTREPFIPVALFLYSVSLFYWKNKRFRMLSILAFGLLSFFVLLTVPLKEYIINLTRDNFVGVIQGEVANNGSYALTIAKSIGYPIYIFFQGSWSGIRFILILLSANLILLLSQFIRKKQIQLSLFVVVALGLSAVRIVPPGTVYFSAYRMLPWTVLFLASNVFLLAHFLKNKRHVVSAFGALALFITWLYPFVSKTSFVWENIDRQKEFYMNYSQYFSYGEIIKNLSDSDDTLLVNDYDSLVYWQAGLDPSYRYTFYYPVMQVIPEYIAEREDMFHENPPDFYYQRSCTAKQDDSLPSFIINEYAQLQVDNRHTCLSLLKKKIKQLTKQQIANLNEQGYYYEDD